MCAQFVSRAEQNLVVVAILTGDGSPRSHRHVPTVIAHSYVCLQTAPNIQMVLP